MRWPGQDLRIEADQQQAQDRRGHQEAHHPQHIVEDVEDHLQEARDRAGSQRADHLALRYEFAFPSKAAGKANMRLQAGGRASGRTFEGGPLERVGQQTDRGERHTGQDNDVQHAKRGAVDELQNRVHWNIPLIVHCSMKWASAPSETTATDCSDALFNMVLSFFDQSFLSINVLNFRNA